MAKEELFDRQHNLISNSYLIDSSCVDYINHLTLFPANFASITDIKNSLIVFKNFS